MQMEELLKEVSVISKKYELIYQKTGGRFNIFEIAAIDDDEVKVCKILRELLDPNGSHAQGSVYLKLFAKIVLKMDICDDILCGAEVFSEFLTDGNRRIDLVLKTRDDFIPIEVKIHAGDQERQVADYYEHANKVGKQNSTKLFYLTLDGRPPSPGSAEGMTKKKGSQDYEEIKNISFGKDICNWLSECMKETPENAQNLRVSLKQFLTAIEKITNTWESPETMRVTELIFKEPENRRAALAIKKAIEASKPLILQKLFDDFKGMIKNTPSDTHL
jgi:hypothetical protein